MDVRIGVLHTPKEILVELGDSVDRAELKAKITGALKEDADDPKLLERTLADVCLVGTPESVREQMAGYAAAGVTRFELRVAPGDMPTEMVARTIRLVGEEIIPRLG